MSDFTEQEADAQDESLEFCDHCGEDFRYDDCGGYNPPCDCHLNCAHCCEHGACDREGDGDDGFCPECGRSDCDHGGAEAVSPPAGRADPKSGTENG